MSVEAAEAAKRHLDGEGVAYGDLISCHKFDRPGSKGKKETWVVEFMSKGGDERIGNDHIIVLVDPQTLKAEVFPTL